MLKEVSKLFLRKSKVILLIILGSITWSWTMVKSGWLYTSLGNNGSGLGFWGANGHDGIWHIALAESLLRRSFSMPVFAGSVLQNYHLGFDLLLAFLGKITSIPISNLYFQILPPVFASVIGLLVYLFVWNWQHSERAAWWTVFFVYFGGSFGWITTGGESAFWSQQGVSTLINPPFALSLIFLIFGLILLLKLENKFSNLNFVLSILVFGSLLEIKAYAGILALGALFVSGSYLLIVNKKSYLLKIFFGSLILSLVLYLPLNRNSLGLLVFQPFWFLETMMGMVDRLNWAKFYSAMMTYRSGHVWIKELAFYFIAFMIFVFGNLGSRVVFLFRKIKVGWMEIFIYSIIAAGVVIPTLFLQKGTPWNTIQFFYYSLFFTSILTGVVIGKFVEKSKINTSMIRIIEVLLILLTVPTTILTLKDVYIPLRPPAMLPLSEISALTFLSTQPQGVVLTKPFDDFSAKVAINNPPRPLYLYTSTTYVSAFSKHQTFLEDEVNLDITGYPWQERREKVLTWYLEKNTTKSREFLTQNNIKYIYWIKTGILPLDLGKLQLSNIYENDLITIYRVD